MKKRGTLSVGDEFGWRTIDGMPHYGRVSDIDSNVIYIKCRECDKECCTEGRHSDFGEDS